MKVFISVDMEGMAGITHTDHTKMEGLEYEMARKWMTAEANAAIEGAFEAGASDIVVADAHGFMRNILPHELHEEAQLVRGIPRPLFQMEGLDDSFAAALLIGYHVEAGDRSGILSHTHVGRSVHQMRINGDPVNEVAFNTAVAGEFGVPLALVAGDDKLTDSVAVSHPWAELVTTKWAISRLAARNLSPAKSQGLIRAATKRALGRLPEMKVVKLEAPITFEIDFLDPIFAELAGDIPGVDRHTGRGVRYVGQDMLEINRIWRLMINSSLSSFPV